VDDRLDDLHDERPGQRLVEALAAQPAEPAVDGLQGGALGAE
jgi:hypothetical protein